jgi:glycosyltransferase involved in cell wall biosynthesis
MSAPAVSICAPAYDEEECIEGVVRDWLAMLDRARIDGEVVVTDDGSRDHTPEILARLAAEDPRVHVAGGRVNEGYGRALRTAIATARGDFVVTIDADGQFDPADVPRLMERQREGDYDLVTGYRVKKRDTILRVAADHALRRLVRGLFGLHARDPNCALKLVRRSWLVTADLDADGYPTPTEIMVRAHHDGLRIAEIAVAHRAREGGATKLRLVRTALDATRFLLALRLRLLRGGFPRGGSRRPSPPK